MADAKGPVGDTISRRRIVGALILGSAGAVTSRAMAQDTPQRAPIVTPKPTEGAYSVERFPSDTDKIRTRTD